jgi:hypothetical protein
MMDEFYYLSKYVHFSYSDMIKMPIFERKYFINKLVTEFEKKNEQAEQSRNKR